jgi:hypothetical protein
MALDVNSTNRKIHLWSTGLYLIIPILLGAYILVLSDNLMVSTNTVLALMKV